MVVPGPSVLFIITRSITDGRYTGLLCGLGVETGTLIHVAAAAIGLSALLASSATAFAVVKYAGAAYLVYLGIRAFRRRKPPTTFEAGAPQAPAKTFRQGLLVKILNPKVALFFLAFLPQFVDPARGPAWSQILVLGALLAGLGLVSDSLYALAAARAGGWLRRHPRVLSRERYLSGTVYVGLGVGAALSGENRLAAKPA
ncbi:MAG: LysE family translocator [Geodermatophilaceae bacterium]|nr:LysE family translocator [Geodermatophilaceae bacterium]